MKKLFPALAVLVVSAAGCAPDVDIESERVAIRELHDACLKAAQAKDVEQLLSCFANDAVWFPPNAPLRAGKQAIREFVSELMAGSDFAVAHKVGKVEVARSGDLAYLSYAYELTVNDPEGKPVTDRGKEISVLRKQPDGAWKIVIHIWNSDQPAARAPK